MTATMNETQHDDELVSETDEAVARKKIDLVVPGLILTVVGLSLVLFLVYVMFFTTLRQERSQHQLLNIFTTPAGAVPLSGKLPANGTPAAVLTIPSIGVRQLVLQGTTAVETAQGPGILTQAARPGTIGNAVIIGRKMTAAAPFANLDQLRKGQSIYVASGLGKFRYVVFKYGIATPGQVDPASPVNRPQLTLVTSNNPVGSSDLYYVVARQLTKPGATARVRRPPTAAELGLAGYPGAVLPSILLGLLYLVAISLTVVAYRRYRANTWTIYLLTTPIILAVALWWFENLYLLLPASM